MKPRGRVLHFAVSGMLVGGGAVEAGCRPKHGEEYSNTGPMSPPDDDLHVNPGPDADPPPDEVTPTNPGPQPEPEPPENVNEGPVEEPAPVDGPTNVRKVEDVPPAEPTPRYVNTVKVEDQPPPKPEKK